MKTRPYDPSAFSNRRFVSSLSVFVAGTILASFAASGFPNGRSAGTKSAARGSRSPTATHGVPAGGQNFWMQTNGPQGGDGIALTTNSSDHVFVGTQGGGVFRSTDNAETWTAVNNGLDSPSVRSLAINSGGDIFAGTFYGGVYRSTDNGENWTLLNTGHAGLYVPSLAINASGHVFAATWDIKFCTGIFRSSDNGDSWTEINNGLTN